MTPAGRTALILATWFGCGRAPVAPGTFGALGALPLCFVLKRFSPIAYWTTTAAVTAIGVWAAQRAAAELGEEDPSSVVIDEVAGTLIALGIAGPGVARSALAFALFRALDVWKPGPIDTVQSLKPNGVGIMADDVLAGVAAGVVANVVARVAGL